MVGWKQAAEGLPKKVLANSFGNMPIGFGSMSFAARTRYTFSTLVTRGQKALPSKRMSEKFWMELAGSESHGALFRKRPPKAKRRKALPPVRQLEFPAE